MITGTTKLLGVIGDPVEHSLSPVMHNAVIAALKADYVYLPLPIQSQNLAVAIAGLKAIDVQGFNITIPHKQTIMPWLEEMTPEAKMIGAVNTVWQTPQGWAGTNTDCYGFMAPLKSMPRDWTQVTPFILGNGGACRAVVVGCYDLGCPEIHVFGRSQSKLDHFHQSWQNTPLQERLKVHLWDQLEGMISQTQLLINTTPVGMFPNSNQCPVTDAILAQLASHTVAYDLIYTPQPTLFLKKAQAQGAIIIDGLEMLVQQGAKALEIWLEQEIPVEIMRKALRQALHQQG